MKTYFQNSLLLLLLFFVVWSCTKDEAVEIEHTITGQLTPGINVTSNDFSAMEVTLGKLNSTIDITNYDRENLEFDTILYAPVDASGSFSFENLKEGNYLAIMSDGFVFNTDTIWSCSINESTKTVELNKTVDRAEEENGTKTYSIKVYRDLGKHYSIKTLYFYYDNNLYRSIDVGNMELGGLFSTYATVEIELDLSRNLTFNADIINNDSGNIYTLGVKDFNKDYNSSVTILEEDGKGYIGIEINKYFKYRIKLWGVVPSGGVEA